MAKIILLILVIALVIGTLGCVNGQNPPVNDNKSGYNGSTVPDDNKSIPIDNQSGPIDEQKAYLASDEKAATVPDSLSSANNGFAFDIFKELTTEDQGQNIFISPFSISTALAMAYDGAEGTTKDAMVKTLWFEGYDRTQLNQDYLNLIESLEAADYGVNLSIANSIWIRDSFESAVKQTFLDGVATYFRSGAYTRDFAAPATVDEINGWISDKTNGKIDKMLEKINPQIVLFLINAIYFKGDWKLQFDESKTTEADFHLADGSTTKVDMMSIIENFSFYDGDQVKAVRLPYGRDKIAMYLFLPKNGTLDSFVNGLDGETFGNYVSMLKIEPNLPVRIPKFKIEYGVKRLNDALINLGMGIAFTDAADLSSIAGGLYIDFVDHKAFIEVNEKGTEAAAATIVGGGVTSGPSYIPEFTADKPFFFVIRDDRSGTILFMGKVENPPLI